MKVRISPKILSESLGQLLSITEKRVNLRPYLSLVFIEVLDGTIKMSATDMEVSSKIIVEADVEEEGAFCVSGNRLFDILKGLDKEFIILEKESENHSNESLMRITGENIFYSLLVQDTEEFPQLDFYDGEFPCLMEGKKLNNLITKVSHAVGTDEIKIHLNSIFLTREKEKLRSVATDGNRLAMMETSPEKIHGEIFKDGIIIPKKGFLELKKMADHYRNETIGLLVDGIFLNVAVNSNHFLSIRPMAGEYPRYQNVIPKSLAFKCIVNRNLLLDAVKRIKIMSNEKSYGVRILFTENLMNISATHPSMGNAREKIPVEYDGEDIEIGLNAQYLIDTLSPFYDEKEEDIELNFDNDSTPIMATSKGSPEYLGIIMPLQL